jgi:hypothetical protein
VGDEYPSAQILGIDLSPIQPAWVPSNVKFRVDDVTLDWMEPENFYDFVHVCAGGAKLLDFHMAFSLDNLQQILTCTGPSYYPSFQEFPRRD